MDISAAEGDLREGTAMSIQNFLVLLLQIAGQRAEDVEPLKLFKGQKILSFIGALIKSATTRSGNFLGISS